MYCGDVILNNNRLLESPLKSSGENGIFNKYDWIKEADSKLISAKLLRESAYNKQCEFDSFKKLKVEMGERLTSKEVFDFLTVKVSANKSSVLMLGYSIELLLKSGVVSLLINAPKNLLDKKVRSYSHNLLDVALDLDVKLSDKERDLLEILSSYIIRETRYPVIPNSQNDYCAKVNKITNFISDENQFSLGVKFFERLRKFIKDIDGTSDNVKFHTRMKMEENGYIIFRVGGKLPPVFIIKFCQSQIDAGVDSLETVNSLLLDFNKVNKTIHSHLMEKSWDSGVFYIVDGKKGLTRASNRHINR